MGTLGREPEGLAKMVREGAGGVTPARGSAPHSKSMLPKGDQLPKPAIRATRRKGFH